MPRTTAPLSRPISMLPQSRRAQKGQHLNNYGDEWLLFLSIWLNFEKNIILLFLSLLVVHSWVPVCGYYLTTLHTASNVSECFIMQQVLAILDVSPHHFQDAPESTGWWTSHVSVGMIISLIIKLILWFDFNVIIISISHLTLDTCRQEVLHSPWLANVGPCPAGCPAISLLWKTKK